MFKAEDALQKAKPEWKERLKHLGEPGGEDPHKVAEEYCREIATIIVKQGSDYEPDGSINGENDYIENDQFHLIGARHQTTKRMKKRIYLSGRMSGLPEFIWWNRFRLAQYKLEAKYGNVKVVNPAETIVANMPWLYRLMGYRLTLWYDLRLLRRCTHIYMVGNDWHISRGARLERMKARQWGIEELK